MLISFAVTVKLIYVFVFAYANCLFSHEAAHLECLNFGPSANLGPVVQSIVSLMISLRHKFVKQISAKVTNTLLFFVEKM